MSVVSDQRIFRGMINIDVLFPAEVGINTEG